MNRASIQCGQIGGLTLCLLAGPAMQLLPSTSRAQTVPETKLAAPSARLNAEFTRVAAIRELGDGRVLVTDAGAAKLFVADFARQTLTQIGRSGKGPNEYTGVASLLPLASDSTLLPDPRGGRWLLLHGSGIVAMVPPDSPPIRAGARNPLGADDGGHVLTTTIVRSLEGSGSTTMGAGDSLWILRISRVTGNIDTLGKARARASRITVTGRDRAQTVSIVVNPLAVGEQVVLYPDGWVAVARVEPYRVDWLARDGKDIRGAELPATRVRVDDAVKRWVLEDIALQTGRAPAKAENMLSDWPATIPPFSTGALLPGPDGRLWIRRAATEATSPTRYDIVDRQGRLVRRVVLARNARVIGFGVGTVYSVATDDDGIQRLQRHAMPR